MKIRFLFFLMGFVSMGLGVQSFAVTMHCPTTVTAGSFYDADSPGIQWMGTQANLKNPNNTVSIVAQNSLMSSGDISCNVGAWKAYHNAKTQVGGAVKPTPGSANWTVSGSYYFCYAGSKCPFSPVGIN